MTRDQIFSSVTNGQALLWDFDGVILDSMSVRDDAFRDVLNEYEDVQVQDLLAWHRRNGGLSRYVKFRYFLTDILGLPCDEEVVQEWALGFSEYCKERLVDQSKLIAPTIALLESLNGRVPMHIVSGSDGRELRELCLALGVAKYFVSIEGSPTPKLDLVSGVVQRYGYDANLLWLIGDASNDKDAAEANGVRFIGFRNKLLKESGCCYWDD